MSKTSNGVDIRALADLARMRVSDEELAGLEKEIPDIIAFVEEMQAAGAEIVEREDEHRNAMRQDGEPHERGAFSDDLLGAAPAVEKGRVKVKQVLKK